MPEKTYTTFEVSRVCGVYPTTVINWVKQNKLPAFATPGGHRRIRKDDLVSFLKKYNFPTPAELSATRRSVMIVNEDKALTQALEKAFAQHREHVEAVVIDNGVEAMVAVGRRAPDLVVLDVATPVIDGATICATFKDHPDTRSIRILALSSKKLSDRQMKFFKAKADGLYVKPFNVDAIVRKTAELLKIDLEL